MQQRDLWARLVFVGCFAGVGGCSNDDGGGAADTDTDTDFGTTTDTVPETETDTDADTETNGEPEPITTELTIDVTFANEMAMTVTHSLHVWVLQPKPDAAVTCADLVSDAVDPYDLELLRLADHVSTTPADPVVIEAVEVGGGFVYVEGVSIGGMAELAGCGDVELVEPSTSIEIVLGLAGTFDCADPNTEEGSPCDDGMFCTVGETCSGGSCQGGNVRDCSILADQCNAASCSEVDGCALEPVPNDTSCDDTLACTQGDSCQDGTCVGAPIDCSVDVPLCQQSAGCVEPTGTCVYVDADDGLPCDDELFCTVDTVCVSGMCIGDPMECPGDDCNVGICDELAAECTTTFADDTTTCSDTENECTADTGLCDGAGICEAAPANEGGICDIDGTPGTCEAGTCI